MEVWQKKIDGFFWGGFKKQHYLWHSFSEPPECSLTLPALPFLPHHPGSFRLWLPFQNLPGFLWGPTPLWAPHEYLSYEESYSASTTSLTAHIPGMWQPSSQIYTHGQIRPGDNRLKCCNRTSPHGGPSSHTLMPIPYRDPNQEQGLFCWAESTWNMVAEDKAGHSPSPVTAEEGEKDWKVPWGFPGWVRAAACRWVSFLVAPREPCLGNEPFSSPMTIVLFGETVAVLPAQQSSHALHSLV